MLESMKKVMIALNKSEESGKAKQPSKAIKPFLAELMENKQSFVNKSTQKSRRLSQEQYTVLEQLAALLSRHLQESLSGLCHQAVTVTALSPKEIAGEDLAGTILSGANFAFSTSDESALARLAIDNNLALLLVDLLLGGAGEEIDSSHTLTPLETQILRDSQIGRAHV